MNDEIDHKTLPTGDAVPDCSADLRAIRESKGISLRDIFDKTRISAINLEAIENGDFGKLPAPVSARTFIKTYARIVGVDSAPILSRYAGYLESCNARKAETPAENKGEEEEPLPSPRATKKPWTLWIWLVVLAGILAAALLFLNRDSSRTGSAPVPSQSPSGALQHEMPMSPALPSDGADSAKTIEAQEKKETTKAEEGGRIEQKQEKTPIRPSGVPAAESGGKYHLIIEAKDLTWLRIRVDSNPPYEVMMRQGERIERFAGRQIQLDIGNEAGIDVIFDGQSLGSLGERAKVVHLTLP